MKLGTRMLIDGFKKLNGKSEKSVWGADDGRKTTAHYLRGLRRTAKGYMNTHYFKLLLSVLT